MPRLRAAQLCVLAGAPRSAGLARAIHGDRDRTGVCHGSFDSEAEVAACLVFAKLGHDQVEMVSDASAMTRRYATRS